MLALRGRRAPSSIFAALYSLRQAQQGKGAALFEQRKHAVERTAAVGHQLLAKLRLGTVKIEREVRATKVLGQFRRQVDVERGRLQGAAGHRLCAKKLEKVTCELVESLVRRREGRLGFAASHWCIIAQ